MQRTSGIYRLTQIPQLYAAFQGALSGAPTRDRLAREFLEPKVGERILDIGCGSASILPHLGAVRYHGIDANKRHIEQARAKHGDLGVFSVGDLSAAAALPPESFDAVYCIGVYHHLNDDKFKELAHVARDRLASGGRMIGIDPAFVPGQHWIARLLAEADSGKCVRTPDAYAQVLSDVFENVETRVSQNLLRVPYTHAVTIARK